MALVPIFAGGKTRLVNVPDMGSERSLADAEENDARRHEAQRRRVYYAGEQYDKENWDKALACNLDPYVDRLPEHERKHAYSTHIAECVDFVADQLTQGFKIVAVDTTVQGIVNTAVAATEILNGGSDDDELTADDLLRDTLIAGDTPYEIRWNPIDGYAWPEFWEAEQVDFDVPYGQHVKTVTRSEVIWVKDEHGEEKQVTERKVYELAVNERGVEECRRQTFWDQEEDPRHTEWLGMPIVPWGLLRSDKHGLRGFRGDSVIRSQCMETVDRYNAIEQLSFLIARYNSHGNLVITGDGAMVGAGVEPDGKVHKDVADVLKFPGGTTATALTLPTDPQMIEHQRSVCADAIYASFGLTRVEPDTIEGLGGISGYALEILNRKSEGTFRRIRRNWRKDWIRMVNLILDVTAYRQEAVLAVLNPETLEMATVDLSDPEVEIPEDLIPVSLFEDVEPANVFPNREVEIEMASGYIVDEVAIRDDFTAKLVSRREALRKRGYDEAEIDKMLNEEADDAPEETGASGLAAAEIKAALAASMNGSVAGTGSQQAGSTNTTRA